LTNCLYFPLRASSMFPGIRLDCIHLPFVTLFFFPLRLFPYAVAKEHSREDSLETGNMEV